MSRKYSKKRQAILELLSETKSHPSAEWIYNQLKPQYSDLSLGTVYRNLNLFKEEGEIVSIATVNGQERFDYDTSDHAHFICKECGLVSDVRECELPSGFKDGAEDKLGGAIDSIRLEFYGKCKKCVNHRAV